MVGAASLVLSQGRARPEYSSGPRSPGTRTLVGARKPNEPPVRPGGSSLLCWERPGLDGLLREVALHGRLARQVDPTLAVDFEDDDHDLVADGHDVLDGRNVVVGQLADPDEAFLARQDLDEGAEAHDPGDLAHVERAHLDLTGQAVDPVDGLASVLARHGRDLDRAVVLDVDLGRGLFLDL